MNSPPLSKENIPCKRREIAAFAGTGAAGYRTLRGKKSAGEGRKKPGMRPCRAFAKTKRKGLFAGGS
jgi:hypothetical protein